MSNLQAKYRQMLATDPAACRNLKLVCNTLRARLGFEVNDTTLKRQVIYPVEEAIRAEGDRGGLIINGGTF